MHLSYIFDHYVTVSKKIYYSYSECHLISHEWEEKIFFEMRVDTETDKTILVVRGRITPWQCVWACPSVQMCVKPPVKVLFSSALGWSDRSVLFYRWHYTNKEQRKMPSKHSTTSIMFEINTDNEVPKNLLKKKQKTGVLNIFCIFPKFVQIKNNPFFRTFKVLAFL